MEITDDLLDQLEALKTKRIQDIADNGIDFDLFGSEKTIKGIYDRQASTVTVSASTPIRPGITIKSSKTGELYLAAISHKAGVDVAEVLPVLGELEVMAVKSGSYHRSSSIPVVSRKSESIGIPAHCTIPSGTIVKHSGQLMSVTAAKRDGAVTLLKLSPVPAQPKAPGLKFAQPPASSGPITMGFRTLRS